MFYKYSNHTNVDGRHVEMTRHFIKYIQRKSSKHLSYIPLKLLDWCLHLKIFGFEPIAFV